jgi:Flp pilus assembly protein TadG
MTFDLRRFWKSTRGTALAEAAIVLPVLVLMLGAAAEFGRFMYYYNTLDKATVVSARYISTRALTASNLADTRNMAVYGNTAGTGGKVLNDSNFTTAKIIINPTSGTPQTVTVSISGYTYTPIFAIGPMANLLGVQIRPSTTMRYLINTPTV